MLRSAGSPEDFGKDFTAHVVAINFCVDAGGVKFATWSLVLIVVFRNVVPFLHLTLMCKQASFLLCAQTDIFQDGLRAGPARLSHFLLQCSPSLVGPPFLPSRFLLLTRHLLDETLGVPNSRGYLHFTLIKKKIFGCATRLVGS